MKRYGLTIVVIETEEDALSHFMHGNAKPKVGSAILSGCFGQNEDHSGGTSCSTVEVRPAKGQPIWDAVHDELTEQFPDDLIFDEGDKKESNRKK